MGGATRALSAVTADGGDYTVHIVVGVASWLSDFRSELLGFPAGKHDDIVDALGLIGQLLDYMVEGTPLPKPDKTKSILAISCLTTKKQTNCLPGVKAG